jgi:asparagine synthase (glutamine-hydrolysing)
MVKNCFDNRLCTFSVEFADSRFDETLFQRRAAQNLGSEHRVIRCTDQDIAESLPDVVWHSETPLLRTAPAPMFRLSKLVKESDYKVVLTGEGSDEIFAGYDIFKEDRVRRFWARQPDSKMRPKLFRKLYPDIFGQAQLRGGAFLEGFFKKDLTRVDLPFYSHKIRWDNTSLIQGFFSDQLRSQTEGIGSLSERLAPSLPSGFMNWDPLSRAQYTESTIFLSNYLLPSQGDRVGLANSVEGRFPFLDYRIVEFATRVPPNYRLHGLKDKFILRQAAKKVIPADLAERPKRPYRAPITSCFLGDTMLPYVEDLFSESALRQKGYFDPNRVMKLVEKSRRQEGHLLSERENMAIIGILSTQLLDEMFIKNFPFHPIAEPEKVRVYDFRSVKTFRDRG